MATQKQVNYLLMLLKQHGYATDWMTSKHKALGATMRQRVGPVSRWLASLDVATASALIDELKEGREP